MNFRKIKRIIFAIIVLVMFTNLPTYAWSFKLPFPFSVIFSYNGKSRAHLNEIVAFDDEGGVGRYFDVEINGRTFRFKEVLLNNRSYEQSDAEYLILEKNLDIIDVGILSSGYYTVVVYNKRVGITEDERIKIQGEAAHGLGSFGTENIIKTAESLSCDAIEKKNYVELTKFEIVKGKSGIEYYKESAYIMYQRLDSGVFYRMSFETLLKEFAEEKKTTDDIIYYEYENEKWTIDANGIVMFVFDKPSNMEIMLSKPEKTAEDYYAIGEAYEEGNGVRINYNLAAMSYEKAGELGSSAALYRLGRMYDFARGVERDYKISKECYEKAIAIDGNDKAAYNLGVLYANGFGVEKNLDKAKELYELAAEKNNMYALHNLAMMYNDGTGAEKDYIMAAKYFRLAGEAGNGYSYSCLGIIYEMGKTGVYDYEEARECYEKGMEMGSSDAYCNLGLMYLGGSYNNVPNIELGREYLEKAAAMGNERAINLLNAITTEMFPSLANDIK